MIKQYALLLIVLSLICSCDANRIYEEDKDFDDKVWPMDSIAVFTFDIADVSPKNLILKLRNDLTYPFQNCYVNFNLLDSANHVVKTDLLSLQLFDQKTGKPQGKGNSVYQFQEMILSNYAFPHKGTYRIEFAQYMRASTLEGTYSVGIRVEEFE